MSGWVAMVRPAEASGRNRTIRFDIDNRLYLGTETGLAVAGADTTLWVDAPGGLRGKDVTSLMIDSDDMLWVGFRRDGISIIPLAGLRR